MQERTSTDRTHLAEIFNHQELIRYVLATPGKRSEEVHVLLHLDQIETLRTGLQKIANGAEKQLKPLEGIAGKSIPRGVAELFSEQGEFKKTEEELKQAGDEKALKITCKRLKSRRT